MEERDNPYVGAYTFTYLDRKYFFGRDREARELLGLVISQRLVVFYAQSGAGKSSLINTRLAPELREAGFAVLPVARVSGYEVTSTEDKGDSLAAEIENIYLYNLMHTVVRDQGDPLRYSKTSLCNFLARLVSEDGLEFHYNEAIGEEEELGSETEPVEEGIPYVLIIDQFEEIVTTNPKRWQEREGFFSQLNEAMIHDPNLWVVLSLREDYVGSLDRYAPFIWGHLQTRYYMERMKDKAALQAIEQPALEANPKRLFAPGVAEKLVDDLRLIKVQQPDGSTESVPGEYVEPVQLQLVCYNLWESLLPEKEVITFEDLQAIGDLNQTLGEYYATSVAAVAGGRSKVEDAIRLWVENQLIGPGGIRRQVLFEPEGSSSGLDNSLITGLEGKRLIREVKLRGATWYELTHDRLVEAVCQDNDAWRAGRREKQIRRLKIGLLAVSALVAVFLLIALGAFINSTLPNPIKKFQYGRGVANSATAWPVLPVKWTFEGQKEQWAEVEIVVDERLSIIVEPEITLELLGDRSGQGFVAEAGNKFSRFLPESDGLYEMEARTAGFQIGQYKLYISLESPAELVERVSDVDEAIALCQKGIAAELSTEAIKGICGRAAELVAMNMGKNASPSLSLCSILRSDEYYQMASKSGEQMLGELADGVCGSARIPRDSQISGYLNPGESNRWPLAEGKKGQIVALSMTGSYFNPSLTLLNQDGEVVGSVSTTSAGQEARIEWLLLPEDGQYEIEAANPGNDPGSYSLALTQGTLQELAFKNNDATIAGELCRFGIEKRMPTSVFSPVCNRAVLLASRDQDTLLGSWLCGLIDYKDLAEVVEGACTLIQQPIAFGEVVNDELEPGAIDRYTFEGRKEQFVTLSMEQASADGVDPILRLLSPDGRELIQDDDGGEHPNAFINGYLLGQSGNYVIEASSIGDTAGAYKLSLVLKSYKELVNEAKTGNVALTVNQLCKLGIDEKLATEEVVNACQEAVKQASVASANLATPATLSAELCSYKRLSKDLHGDVDDVLTTACTGALVTPGQPITVSLAAGSVHRWRFDNPAGQATGIAMNAVPAGSFVPYLILFRDVGEANQAAETIAFSDFYESGMDSNALILLWPSSSDISGTYEIEAGASFIAEDVEEYTLTLEQGTLDELATNSDNPYILNQLCFYDIGESDFGVDYNQVACQRLTNNIEDVTDLSLLLIFCNFGQNIGMADADVQVACGRVSEKSEDRYALRDLCSRGLEGQITEKESLLACGRAAELADADGDGYMLNDICVSGLTAGRENDENIQLACELAAEQIAQFDDPNLSINFCLSGLRAGITNESIQATCHMAIEVGDFEYDMFDMCVNGLYGGLPTIDVQLACRRAGDLTFGNQSDSFLLREICLFTLDNQIAGSEPYLACGQGAELAQDFGDGAMLIDLCISGLSAGQNNNEQIRKACDLAAGALDAFDDPFLTNDFCFSGLAAGLENDPSVRSACAKASSIATQTEEAYALANYCYYGQYTGLPEETFQPACERATTLASETYHDPYLLRDLCVYSLGTVISETVSLPACSLGAEMALEQEHYDLLTDICFSGVEAGLAQNEDIQASCLSAVENLPVVADPYALHNYCLRGLAAKSSDPSVRSACQIAATKVDDPYALSNQCMAVIKAGMVDSENLQACGRGAERTMRYGYDGDYSLVNDLCFSGLSAGMKEDDFIQEICFVADQTVENSDGAYYLNADYCISGRAAGVDNDLLQAACQATFDLVKLSTDVDFPVDLCLSSLDAGLRDDETLSACQQAVELAVQSDDAFLNNQLCWSGSLSRIEALVLPACERAVVLAAKIDYFQLYDYRDSRGLALALIGDDIDAAIEDFEFYVQQTFDDHNRLERLSWIADLKAGNNPFNEQTLNELRQ